ncbi:MAG TPA: hypothetical protein DCW46_06755, partial [Desulfotomaculum sp.]|nr:hypothetical protein [Desulfotomaculum sp.]
PLPIPSSLLIKVLPFFPPRPGLSLKFSAAFWGRGAVFLQETPLVFLAGPLWGFFLFSKEKILFFSPGDFL